MIELATVDIDFIDYWLVYKRKQETTNGWRSVYPVGMEKKGIEILF